MCHPIIVIRTINGRCWYCMDTDQKGRITEQWYLYLYGQFLMWLIRKITCQYVVGNSLSPYVFTAERRISTNLPWRLLTFLSLIYSLTHFGLLTKYGDIDLGQHWLSQWFGAWHQTTIWINVDFILVSFCSMPWKAISQQILKLLFWVTHYAF